MKVLLTSEARFERTPDGTVWGSAAYGHALWRRYLDVFTSVLIAARVREVREPSHGCTQASSPEIQFWPVPVYAGLGGLLRHLRATRSRLAEAVRRSDAVIVRVPSPLAYLTARAAAANGRPFGAEIVGDADQVFAPGAFHHPLRGAIRHLAATGQRHLSRDAVAVLYVTREALQRRYPTAGRSFAASDVALDDFAFCDVQRQEWKPPAPFVLVTVGGLDQPYKGTAILLEAISVLRRSAQPVRLRIVGGGRLLPQFRQQCESLGLATDVEFLGQQDATGVRAALDSAHLFVLPSLTEGLPRALLEAMARGLPAVATRVGGVPELLAADCLVAPGDAHELASRIVAMMADPVGRRRCGEANRAHARVHHERRHTSVRREFFETVRRASAQDEAEVRCA